MHFQIFVCFLALSSFFLNANPNRSSQQSQFIFITDIRKEMLNPATIASSKYLFFNNSESPGLSGNDSIEIQKSQSDASRVIFGKITLESVGAVGSGMITGFLVSRIGKEILGYGIGFSFGPAIGTTLIGNNLMEPNGSFTKSLIGSMLGMFIGGGIYFGYTLSHGLSLEPASNAEEIIFTTIAIGLPVFGAVVGYNLGISVKSTGSTHIDNIKDFHRQQEIFDGLSINYQTILIKLK